MDNLDTYVTKKIREEVSRAICNNAFAPRMENYKEERVRNLEAMLMTLMVRYTKLQDDHEALKQEIRDERLRNSRLFEQSGRFEPRTPMYSAPTFAPTSDLHYFSPRPPRMFNGVGMFRFPQPRASAGFSRSAQF